MLRVLSRREAAASHRLPVTMDDDRPIFVQIAELIENSVIDGTLAEETQVPSTNELAAFHRINPATAAKGINRLVDDGILYKRRGIGMFVATGARETLRERRRLDFAAQYVRPLVDEARKLGIGTEELKKLIETWEEQR
ncbi:GntR family transcriptional regulator [Asanoa ishikariensis]|uniref:DNA-binding transcriptional regulator YhcF, GntR family n=1 Tax=Asanoa ishikariensis TaxID=137265 RepID=A0A1H3PH24_9ACTN|nr:GntR family transcriptional regulator [Asanoa ishikariensis]GIF67808.1 GntR family transcriptional regulator [Asanoa ishikariensis]SDZ00414.1 DNA-binding transcriptional regulator YhcF, GntR family [Asanoa ishikariensis]